MATRAVKRRLSSNKFFVFKGLAFTFLVLSGWTLLNIPTFREFVDTYTKRTQEKEQIALLEQNIRELKKQQYSLKVNGFEAERHVREQLGMHRPGEKVIFLKAEPPKPQVKEEATSTPAARKSRETKPSAEAATKPSTAAAKPAARSEAPAKPKSQQNTQKQQPQ